MDIVYDVWDIASQLLPRNFLYGFSAEDLGSAEGSLSVLTYNVNMAFAIKGKMSDNAERVVAAIRASRADVVLLQETHQGWEQLLSTEVPELPHRAFHFDM